MLLEIFVGCVGSFIRSRGRDGGSFIVERRGGREGTEEFALPDRTEFGGKKKKTDPTFCHFPPDNGLPFLVTLYPFLLYLIQVKSIS